MRLGAALFVLGIALAAPRVAAGQDATTSEDADAVRLRTQFRSGLEKYQAGQYGEAILVWDPIYKELGPTKGYRVALNLARAFDQIHDEPRAADHYEAFLDAVDARQATGEALEPAVVKQRDEANERITELRAKLARLRFRGEEVLATIDAGDVRVARGITYVVPGKHVVVYRPATPDQARVEITAEAGAIVDLEAPPIAPKPVVVTPPPPVMRWETHEERPFPKSVLYVGAAATAVSFVVPALLYSNALGTKDDYDGGNKTTDIRDEYSSQKTTAYASWAIPGVLGAATIALALYWVYGVKTVRTPMALQSAFRGASW